MSEKTKGSLGELITGLRVVARLNASGDFVRVDAKPVAKTPAEEPPFENGWGKDLRMRLMAGMFTPPIFYALCQEIGMKTRLDELLTGMLGLLVASFTLPRMCKRFNFMNSHRMNTCSGEDRFLGGIIVLIACTGIGAGLTALMHAALQAP